MKSIEKKKLVLFGAGKIGRSFIGQLFSNGGYEVVFIDIAGPLIDEMNRRRKYRVIIKGEKEQVLNIENVRGVHLGDESAVIEEVATAGILATSVGLGGLRGIFPVLAKGLLKRYRENPDHPLDIIIAENMRNADEYFREQLMNLLPPEYPFGSLVGLIETSIGKMVPIMHKKDIVEDMLQIFAEPYNTLILNKKGFRNSIPDIKGLAPKENMKAWVDRKLFIHNLGHSASAYLGYLYNNEFIYLWESLAVPEIFESVRSAMLQAAEILMAIYPGEFTCESLTDHIDDLLARFQNKALGDTIFRVGCDLKRKLGPEDRLAGAIHKAFETRLPYDRILFALVCGCYFRASGEDRKMFIDDIDFTKTYGNDISHVMTSVSGFDRIRHKTIIAEASSMDAMIREKGLRASIRLVSGKSLTYEKNNNFIVDHDDYVI
jgi:mannitol-1-phosphate 5-dehydrogenase